MIKLREITPENLESVLALSVSQSQQSYVSTTAVSLAQAYVFRGTAHPFAVYADDTPVGFIMLGYYRERDQYTLWKFLIDQRFQNRGYGKQALILGIEYLKEKFGVSEIYTGVSIGNTAAKHLYRSVGFRETGFSEYNMEELKLVL